MGKIVLVWEIWMKFSSKSKNRWLIVTTWPKRCFGDVAPKLHSTWYHRLFVLHARNYGTSDMGKCRCYDMLATQSKPEALFEGREQQCTLYIPWTHAAADTLGNSGMQWVDMSPNNCNGQQKFTSVDCAIPKDCRLLFMFAISEKMQWVPLIFSSKSGVWPGAKMA